MVKKEKALKREEFKVTYFEECAERLELAETELDTLRNSSDRNSKRNRPFVSPAVRKRSVGFFRLPTRVIG